MIEIEMAERLLGSCGYDKESIAVYFEVLREEYEERCYG